MCMKLLLLRKTNSYAKIIIAASFLANVACKLCSFLMKHFSAKSVGEFFANSEIPRYFISGRGYF